MNHRDIIVGIGYIFWIFAAWFVVTFFNFIFISKITMLNETLITIAKESIRFFVFIGPILIFIFFNSKNPWYRWIGLYGYKKGTFFKTTLVIILYSFIGSVINMYGFGRIPHKSSISLRFLLTAFSLSIIIEEIAFRGFLFYLFKAWNPNKVVIITSLAFAAKHIPGWIFFPQEISPLGFVGDFFMIFFVGCILGYLYLGTHSVWATWTIHAVNNFIVILFQ